MTEYAKKFGQSDKLAIVGIITLVIIFGISPKIGGILITLVVLGMLLQLTRKDYGFSS